MAGKLILMFHDQVLGEFPVEKERMSIGRKATNDIQIDNLAVSGEHCRVTTSMGQTVLEDLGSTNGTLVNGQRITRHVLRNGDLIEVVKHRLKYVNDAAPAAGEPAEEFEKTMVFRPGAMGNMEAVEMSAAQAAREMGVAKEAMAARPSAESATLPKAALRILNGPNAGRELELTKVVTSLGKPGVQVATINKRADGYFLAHVEGKSPPTVNGTAVSGEQKLKDHDVIVLSGIQVEFLYR
ncbi:FHA domain-containing protein [Endothiovibrio diazotrophicus]